MATRHRFLKTAAVAVAARSLPRWYLDEIAEAAPQKTARDDKPAIALIGGGEMGRRDARNASRSGRIVAVSDVDDTAKFVTSTFEFMNQRYD